VCVWNGVGWVYTLAVGSQLVVYRPSCPHVYVCIYVSVSSHYRYCIPCLVLGHIRLSSPARIRRYWKRDNLGTLPTTSR
jgi:hypothetical protein